MVPGGSKLISSKVSRLPRNISYRKYTHMLEYFQIILFLPTPESQDSPMFCAKMGVLGLPQGISNRSYSNMLLPPTPASPDSPILFAKLVVLRPSQRYFK
jgi:hypothetical protein